MADFDVKLSDYGIEFIPVSSNARTYLRRLGSAGELVGPNRAILRDSATAQVFVRTLFGNGLSWNDTEAAAGRPAMVPSNTEVLDQSKTVRPSAPAMPTEGSRKAQHPLVGCSMLIGLPIVAVGVLSLAFCSHGSEGNGVMLNAADDPAKQAALDAKGDALTAEADRAIKSEGSAAPASSSTSDSLAIDAYVASKTNLQATLKDGDSVKYRNAFVSSIGKGAFVTCGEINAKNGFGAYTGFHRFIASPIDGAPQLVEGNEIGLGENTDQQIFEQAYAKVCNNVVWRE